MFSLRKAENFINFLAPHFNRTFLQPAFQYDAMTKSLVQNNYLKHKTIGNVYEKLLNETVVEEIT